MNKTQEFWQNLSKDNQTKIINEFWDSRTESVRQSFIKRNKRVV